jgi:hypothetical protein
MPQAVLQPLTVDAPHRYTWPDSAEGDGGLILIVVLPEGYTLDEPKPRAVEFRLTTANRIVVVWCPKERHGEPVKVEWVLKPTDAQDVKAEVANLNERWTTPVDYLPIEPVPPPFSKAINVKRESLESGVIGVASVLLGFLVAYIAWYFIVRLDSFSAQSLVVVLSAILGGAVVVLLARMVKSSGVGFALGVALYVIGLFIGSATYAGAYHFAHPSGGIPATPPAPTPSHVSSTGPPG